MGGGAPIKGLPEMTAAEARRLSEKNVVNNTAPIIEGVFEKIRAACAKGQFSIVNPLSNIKGVIYPSEAERKAVYSYFTSRGYKIKDHDDPDPGNPISGGGYTSLEW